MKNRKLLRVMSFMFALLLVASSALVVVPFTASAADANTVEINTVDDLYAFANNAESNGWYAGKTVKLNVDIDLEGCPAWTPVAQFKGTFDGNGKTIKNLKIEGATTDLAFIKVLDGATVKNFRLEGSVTQNAGNGMVALLAVKTSGAAVTIDNVYVGGAISTVADNTNNFRDAGFVAYVTVDTTIKNSASAVSIVSGYKASAGFVGATKYGSTLTMTDCVFYGNIDTSVNVETGAFIGRLGGNVTMTRCIKLGFADDQTGQYQGVFMYLDNKDFDTNAAPENYVAPNIVIEDCYTTTFTTTANPVIVIGGHGGRSTGLYNISVKYGGTETYSYVAAGNTATVHAPASAAIKVLADKDTVTLTKDNFATTCPGFTNWVVTEETVAYQTGENAKTVPVVAPKSITEMKPGTFVTGNFDAAWAPDANGVFTIRTVDNLHDFSLKAEANNFYEGKTVKLAADLDLENEQWTPVPEFKGTFDGNGRTIKNLTLSGTERLGFFDKLNGATVKNFRLEGSITELEGGKGMMALLAVETVGAATTIDNVYVVGGFEGQKTTNVSFRHAGFIAYVAADTTIKNSASGVTLYNGDKANSGFVGASKYGTTLTITDCAYYGALAKQMQAETGGFVGRLGGNLTLTRGIVFGYNRPDANSIYNGALFYLDTKSFETNKDNAAETGFVPPVVVVEDCYVNVPGDTTPIIGAHSGRPKYNLTIKYGSETVYTTPTEGDNAGKVVCADATKACKTIAIGADIKLTKDNFATICPGFTGWVATELTAQSVANAPVPVFLPKGVTEIKPGTFVKGESLIEVATADELLAAAQKIADRNGFAGKTIELTADIDMTGKTWTMIDKFSGTLDGNGFAIKNLTVGANESADGLAMFHTLDGATIKNLIITGATVTRTTGGLGRAAVFGAWTSGEATTFENVYVDGTVTIDKVADTRMAAGYVGQVWADTTFTKCVSNVKVVGYATLGGFVGSNSFHTTLTMTDCVFTGVTENTKAELGGFTGRSVGNLNLIRCVNIGHVRGYNQWTGGLAYLESKDFKYLKADGSTQNNADLTTTEAFKVTATFVDCYSVVASGTAPAIGEHGTRSAQKVSISYTDDATAKYEVTDKKPTFGEMSAVIKKLATPEAPTVTKDNFGTEFKTLAVADWVMTDVEVLYNNTIKINQLLPEAVASMLKSNIVAQYTVTATPDWKADANGVFNIATPGDLLAFAANAEANGWYNGKAVQLTADIDMKKVDFVPLAKFMGYFEGNGYTIKNLTVNQKAEPLGGLVNVADGMTMKNVRFVGGSVTMPEIAEGMTGSVLGGIVGNTAGNFPCTFENIYIDSKLFVPNVNTAYRVGGLIGNVSANPNVEATEPAKVTIKNCVSAIEVLSSYKAAAGFVGSNAFGTLVDISDCLFTGSFVKTNAENSAFIGRVVGGVNLTRCVNLGAINQSGNRYSGALGYFDNKDFILDNTFTIASLLPSEINIVDCYTVLASESMNAIGAHDSRRAYKMTISYTGDAAPVYTNATVENFLVDYEAASAAVKQLALGTTVNLNKDNFATVCPTLVSWKLTGNTFSYGVGMNIVEIMPTSVASMIDGTFVKGALPTDIPEWKLPEPTPGGDETTTPGGDETTAPADETTAPADETTAPTDETTKKDEETTAAGKDDKKKGCGSVVGGSIAVIIAIAGGAMFLSRKKED